MKNILILFFVLITLNLSAQSLFKSYEKGKITFRDGSEISGLIKISGKKLMDTQSLLNGYQFKKEAKVL